MSGTIDLDSQVDRIIERVGPRLVVATPLGLGKPVQLINALYARAVQDPKVELRIVTALTLSVPRPGGELERRLVAPIYDRVFGGYPELELVAARAQDELPPNVEVTSFYLPAGSAIGRSRLQRSYVSTNYTHVVRDVVAAGVNVLAQLVAEPPAPERERALGYSLSSNPDLSLDLMDRMREREDAGIPQMRVAQVNRNLPYMYGDSEVAPEAFDVVLDDPALDFPLFAPPNEAVATQDWAIGLHASALIKDGGTLQLGIGSLSDALCWSLMLRHQRSAEYRDLLQRCGTDPRFAATVEALGGRDPFARGLYGASEMLVDGFLSLYRAGILSRMVYDDAGLQRVLDDGGHGPRVTLDLIDDLIDAGVIEPAVDPAQLRFLQRFGIVARGVDVEGDRLTTGSSVLPADLRSPEARASAGTWLGDELEGGHLAHGGFFLGPRSFYQALAELTADERERIQMTRISFVNQLYGDEAIKRAQRRHARFINSGMIATALGAVVSDQIESGQVVSGVGGQYNFVAMAHELDGGRSILLIRSVRASRGKIRSNIRWSYGHTTIPRHLRDIVITEYGIADLRGRTDEEVVKAMLAVADARFQYELLERAKEEGKVEKDYQLPDHCRTNLPERLERDLGPGRKNGTLPDFPFNTDLTDQEIVLGRALRHLAAELAGDLSVPTLSELRKTVAPPDSARPYLERMGLADPQSMEERVMGRALVFALASVDAI